VFFVKMKPQLKPITAKCCGLLQSTVTDKKIEPMKKLPIAVQCVAVVGMIMAGGLSASAQTLSLQLQAANYNPVTGVWTDSSGNGDTATYAKFSGTLTLPVLASGVTPNGSSAVDITAGNGSFNLSSSLSGASGYTIFAYVMPTTDTGGSRFALTGGSAGYALEYNFYQGHQNWLSEYQGGGGAATATIPTSSFSLVDLAVSASGGTFTGGSFRLNGASDGTTGAGAGSTTSPITRVGNNEGGGDGFVGDIAEIDIYSGVLSPSQISTVEANLTAEYVTPVPEPATWAMMAGGFGMLFSIRRFGRPQS
jgi:hypothetical protein